MLKKLSGRDRRALLILGVFLLAGITLWYGLVPLLEQKGRVNDDVQVQEDRLKKYIKEIAQREQYEARLGRLNQLIGLYESRLLGTDDPTQASSQLTQIVRNLADETGVPLGRISKLQDRDLDERFMKITIQVSLTGDVAQLTEFLDAVADYTAFLAVDNLRISSFQRRNERGIQPQMEISGFIRLSEASDI